ncbi:MAG: hypothetical protein JXR48_06785 [Candidatus Delongbacteria bacterium]|nr:hypothetical protein [Candidatus Delongbacteria bacterium]MBN2834656.1 hypothetical protein [Candidatus Delongbacteria bacterium]
MKSNIDIATPTIKSKLMTKTHKKRLVKSVQNPLDFDNFVILNSQSYIADPK